MNLSPVFKSICLRVGRAFGVVAEREGSAASAVHMAADVLNLERRGLTPQKVLAANMPKALSPLIALEPQLRKIIDATTSIEAYAGDHITALLPVGDRRFNAIRMVVERTPGWGDDPILEEIQALAKDGLGDSKVNAQRTVDGAARNQWEILQKIRRLLPGTK